MSILEAKRREWSSVGILFYEVESSIAEFKKGRISDRDITYFKAAIDFLNSVLEAEKEDEVRFASPENLTNSSMFIEGWFESKLAFPRNDKEYKEEVKGFIGVFEKMAKNKQPESVAPFDKIEKLFSFLGELSLIRGQVRHCYYAD